MKKEPKKSNLLNCKAKVSSKKMKEQKGITLIALVVTIVVLLILAGVTITFVLGEGGILDMAKEAADRTNKAIANEQEDVANLVGEISDILEGKDPEELADAVKSQKVFSYTTGYDKEGKKIDVINEENVPAITIPAGFKIVEGSLSEIEEGVVISDKAGNEFVWVPCEEGEYKKHEYTALSDTETDKGTNLEDKGTEGKRDAGWNTWYYRSYNSWTDAGPNEESVKKYGGFYIARYEAGVPSTATFYVAASQTGDKTFSKDKNVNNLKPVSKKGVQAWNYISQINAKTVSTAMYAGNGSVTSQLVDGIAWDTVVEWIAKDPELSDVVKKDSTSHGNYANNKADGNGSVGLKIEREVLYADHTDWRNGNSGAGWNVVKEYKYGIPKSGEENPYDGSLDGYETPKKPNDQYTVRKLLELSTGASEDTKLKNIYDLGGNMYEWTTEEGTPNWDSKNEGATYAVLRGGGFNDNGASGPVSVRNGNVAASAVNPYIGFRVVLYVK